MVPPRAPLVGVVQPLEELVLLVGMEPPPVLVKAPFVVGYRTSQVVKLGVLG